MSEESGTGRRPLPGARRERTPPPNPNPNAPSRGPAIAPSVPMKQTQYLRVLAKRAADVPPEDVDRYIPSEAVLRCTEVILGGTVRRIDIAEQLGVAPETVGMYLADPVACAWVMRQISNTIGDRLALVDAAMYSRALGGDVAAAKLIFERYAPAVQTHRHLLQVGGNDELSKLSDAELMRLAASKKVIDLEENDDGTYEADAAEADRDGDDE